MTMQLFDCTPERHAGAMLDIFNEVIANSTALYDYRARTPQAMADWFELKRSNGFPVIGAEDAAGQLLGFASYGTFRAWPAYKYTVEHSIYVHRERRGLGVGRVLLGALIEAARARDVHVMVGGIDAANVGSIALHTSLGFSHAGTLRQVGFKFGRWLDLAFYQRVLDTPVQPSDG